MTKLLLSIHVLAAIIAIGPVTVAASMFPAATRRALAEPADPRDGAVLRNLHRICRVYATLGVLVPVFGLATANSLGVLGDAWLLTSIALTIIAAVVLIAFVLPGQSTILAGLDREPAGAGLDREPAGAGLDRKPADAGLDGEPTGGDAEAAPVVADSDELVRSRPAGPASRDQRVLARRTHRTAAVSPDRAKQAAARLGMLTGVFNLLWAVVVVLMIVRPGSTTGA